MKRMLLAGVVGVLGLGVLVAGQPAQKVAVIAPQPIPQRVATADAVLVGKVTNIEEKTVAAPAFPGAPQKVEYQIAVVKV